jgi:GT2 family glycosyltransferase
MAGTPRKRKFGGERRGRLYRREALESARIVTGVFDSDFFLYREDADLSWRLQNLGWKCLYVPSAVGYHRRRNLPERRRRMSPLVNFHSVKNRFLLRINNQSAADFAATLVPTLARDAIVLGACLTIERSSLPAFPWLWRNRSRLWATAPGDPGESPRSAVSPLPARGAQVSLA